MNVGTDVGLGTPDGISDIYHSDGSSLPAYVHAYVNIVEIRDQA